jgi:hypothetical protein
MDAELSCTECSQPLHSGDKFCPHCGHSVPAVELPRDVTPEPEPEDSPVPARRKRRIAVIAAVAAVGLIIAGGAIWGLTRSSEAKKQYEASAPVLMSTLDDMSGAQSTRMVRDVAGQAAQQVTAIDAVLDADPQASGSDRLSTLQEAMAALAALTEYTQNDTEVWTDNRQTLVSNLDTLSTYGGVTEQASAEGEDTVRTLDDLTARVDKAMARYRKQVAKARAAAKAERADVKAYRIQMDALIDRYTALRNETGDFVDRMDYEQMYMFEVIDYFTQAGEDRREVANSMASLRPPADLRGVHVRVVTVLGDGADAIDAAVAALEDADCYDGECYFEYNAQWQQFLDESDRITARYGQASDAWHAAIEKAARQAKGADLPAEPNL